MAPIVPNYDSPQVRKQGLPNVLINPSAPAEAFGGGPSLARIGGLQSDILKDEQEIFVRENKERQDQEQQAQHDANRMKAYEQIRAFNDWEQSNVFDPDKGAASMRGRSALGVPKFLTDSFDKFVENQKKGLSNDDQRLAFEGIVTERRESLQRWTRAHVAKQTEIADEAEYEASIDSAKKRVMANPASAAVEIPFIQGLTAERMRKAGLAKGVIESAQAQQASEVHTLLINSMLAKGQNADARRHLAAVRGMITDPQELQRLQHRVDEANKQDNVRGDSQREASKILNGYVEMVDVSNMEPLQPPRERTVGPKLAPRTVYPAETLAEALQRARKIADPEVQDATVKRVKEMWDEREEQRRDAKKMLFDADMKGVEVTGSTAGIPADRWLNTYDGKERAAFEERANQLRKREPTVTTEEGWAKYYQLKDAAATPEGRAAFAKENLWLHRAHWSDAEFKEMVNLQADVKKGDEKAQKKLDGHSTKAEIWKSTLEAEGFYDAKDGTDAAKEEAKKRDRIRRLVDDEVRRREEKSKEEVSAKEYQEILDQLLGEAVTGKKLYQVEQELMNPGLDMIPEADRKIIKEELAILGFRVTEERVKATYRLRLRKDYGYPR